MQLLEQQKIDKQTKLMKKHGPKDTAYTSLLLAEELPVIQKFFSQMNTRENPSQVIEYFDKCEQKWNDHNPVIEVDNKRVEFLQVSRADDVVSIQGLVYSMKLMLKLTTTRWRYHGVGSGNREARCYQQSLQTETEPRADMTIPAQGSVTRVNQSIRFIGIFPASFPTITVRESGIFTINTGTTGTMLNRQVFTATPITHVVSGTAFTVATDVNLVSVTTWG